MHRHNFSPTHSLIHSFNRRNRFFNKRIGLHIQLKIQRRWASPQPSILPDLVRAYPGPLKKLILLISILFLSYGAVRGVLKVIHQQLASWNSIPAPQVDGEWSAGHPRPTWIWSLPKKTKAFRFRINESQWKVVPKDIQQYTPEHPLPTGIYTFEVQAKNSLEKWSPSGRFHTTIEYFRQQGYWRGVERQLTTTPRGHIAAISAHNCYTDRYKMPSKNWFSTIRSGFK